MGNFFDSSEKLHVENPVTDNGRDYAEKSLQNFIAKNISVLRIPNVLDFSMEHQTDVGRLDILVTSNIDQLWVVELKAGVASRDAIGQIVSYIGAVRNLYPGKDVFGILIATDFDKSCLAAHSAVTNVSLRKVRIEYVLEDYVSMNVSGYNGSGVIQNRATGGAAKTDSGNRIYNCHSCGTEREVSQGGQGFYCRDCKSYNNI